MPPDLLERSCGCVVEFSREGQVLAIYSCGACPSPVFQLGLALSASVTKETKETDANENESDRRERTDSDLWWESVLRDGPTPADRDEPCHH